jgi:hypothetical protein
LLTFHTRQIILFLSLTFVGDAKVWDPRALRETEGND